MSNRSQFHDDAGTTLHEIAGSSVDGDMAAGRQAMKLLARLLGLLALGLLLLQLWLFAHVLWWKHNDPASTRFMRLALAELTQNQPQRQLQQQWRPYDAISPHLKRAVVAAEDDRFMTHSGFDWQAMQQALERNRSLGGRHFGASTISQQLAKNLFLSPRRSYVRKLQEAIITLMIESTWSKQRILEVYLNIVEWGEGVFGAEAAAQHYYGISADRLGPVEASQLAVRLPAPRRYEHNFGPNLQAHATRIRQRMQVSRIPP